MTRIVATAQPWSGILLLLAASAASTAWASRTIAAPADPTTPDSEGPARGGDPGTHHGSARRIVSTTLATDEILLALAPPERLLAVSIFADDAAVSNVTEAAAAVPSRVRGSAESVLALGPDLLFAGAVGRPETQMLLAQAGVPVLHARTCNSFADIERNIRWVGTAIDREERAETVIATMRARLRRVTDRLGDGPRPRVLLHNFGNYTAGRGSLFDEEVRLAGGINAASEAGIREHGPLSVERALTLDPDVLLYTDYRADSRAPRDGDVGPLAAEPGYASLRAVREGRLYRLDERSSHSTSHHAVGTVEALAALLHPERMEQAQDRGSPP